LITIGTPHNGPCVPLAAALGAATQELVVTVTAAVFGSAQGFLK
jgi:hypothetical protein